MNILLIGAGYFAQTVYLKCLKDIREVQNVFIFDERVVSAVMTPRTSVFSLECSLKIKEVVE